MRGLITGSREAGAPWGAGGGEGTPPLVLQLAAILSPGLTVLTSCDKITTLFNFHIFNSRLVKAIVLETNIQARYCIY